jgi:hypothetical protein
MINNYESAAQQFAWSGLSKDLGVEFKVICSRSSEPLCGQMKVRWVIAALFEVFPFHVHNMGVFTQTLSLRPLYGNEQHPPIRVKNLGNG